MAGRLTRQQKRKLDRQYQKRFVRAGKRTNRKQGIPTKKGVPEKMEPDSFCFPSFYLTGNKNLTEFQFSLRSFGDAIAMEYSHTPPTVIFIVILKPHPCESDELAEKMARTILSKSLNDNIIMFIHRDVDIESLDESGFDVETDDIISTFIKENTETVLDNLCMCLNRMRGDESDE